MACAASGPGPALSGAAISTRTASTVPGIAALHLRITELLVHGWDLATGQPTAVPTADLAAIELEFSRGPSGPALPPGHSPFAPPQPAPDGAPGIVNDQLAALLGRPLRNPV